MTINNNFIGGVSINEEDHLPVRRQLRKAERCRCSADKGRNNKILRKHNQTLEPDEDAVKHSQHCQHLSKCHLVVKETDI